MANGIEFFHGTWKEAMAKAKEEDKLLFVDAYAKWCGPCKRMAKNVFTQDEVGAFFNDKFINLKLDMEETDGLAFGQKYPVSAYPTLFFLTGDGEVIKKVRGGQQAESLIEHGKVAIQGFDRSGQYEDKYLAGDRSYSLVHDYVKALVQAGKPHQKIANEYLRSNPSISEVEKAQFLFSAATEMDSRIFEEMIEMKNSLIKLVGKEAFDQKVKSACLAIVDKSIEYDYPELLDEAITVANKNLHEGGKAFRAEANMKKANMLNDAALYVLHAKNYVKEHKYDGKVLTNIINELNTKYSSNPNAMEFGAELVKKMMKYGDPDLKSIPLYTKVLTLGDKKTDAKKLIKEAMKKSEGDTPSLKRLEGIQNYIDSLEPLQS
jgi:thiol-disulfide isomerase/thioredoxin